MYVKRVKLNLADLKGDAFDIIDAFSKQARHEQWTEEEISSVVDDAVSENDYNHLLTTLHRHTRKDGQPDEVLMCDECGTIMRDEEHNYGTEHMHCCLRCFAFSSQGN